MPQNVLITGAGSGFGLLAAKTIARDGHTVYGGLLHPKDPNQAKEDEATSIRDVILDVTNDVSIKAAIDKITSEVGHIDVVVHNAGHMCMGPAESFSADQMHEYYEVNAVGTHRINQVVLPMMRKAGRGHIVWVSSSSAKHGAGPLLAPYFAAKAAMHSLAVTLSTEIACWGIETTIIVPGIFTSGTNHFATAGKPAYPDIATEYMEGPLKGADTIMLDNVNKTFPKDASAQLVGDAIAAAINAPRGKKPFRVAIDPYGDGSDEVMALADSTHAEFLKRCGIDEICAFHER